ncbi:MAG: hypothetical protein MJ003_03955 [Paludibacteraceae bacterium]|nr:hypothetical protein [Paludibacteraceae bacterium]
MNKKVLKSVLLFIATFIVSVVMADETEARLDSMLNVTNDAFSIDVSNINNVGSVISDDGKLRIISWNNRLENGSFEYYSYFIFKKNGKSKATVRKFVSKNALKPKNSGKYFANNWYGCLYYKAFATKSGYILLGYQTYQDISRVKLIEPLEIKGNDFILGNDIFRANGKKQSRAVFEYSANAVMSIEYDKSGKRFVFDHLSPENPNLKGVFSYYGPDFTYDSFTLKKKLWVLTEDIDIKNK